MIKAYMAKIDCANCANKMQDRINELNGVKSCSVNYIAQRITIKFEEDADVDSIVKNVIDICKKIERKFEMQI